MVQSAGKLQQLGPTRSQADQFYEQIVTNATTTFDANDFLYWFESSHDYDPEPDLGSIAALLFAVNFEGDMINPSELGLLDQLVQKIPAARAVTVPVTTATLGHQTLTQAAVWKPYLQQLMDQ